MDGDRDGWTKGLRLTLTACVSAVIAAAVVIQVGSALIEHKADRTAAMPVILTAR